MTETLAGEPASAARGVPAIGDEPTEAELRAVVGPRASRYLHRWRKGRGVGFNIAAFFLSGLWLPYRKMYRAALILYAIVVVESMAEELLFVGWLGIPTPRHVERAAGGAVAWICALFGNWWYLTHVRRIIVTERARGHDDPEYLSRLARRGGTTLIGAFGFLLIFIVMLLAGMFIVDLALPVPEDAEPPSSADQA